MSCMTITPKAKPPAPYIGGKRVLAKTIIKQIEAIDHQTYVEPFCGMGGVFFRREHPATCEVINDRNGEVVNLFRILQRHYHAFEDIIRFSISSRDEFERLRAMDPETLTDLERALRFLYLQVLAFGGRVTGPTFGVRATQSARFNHQRLRENLEAICHRLSEVTVENLDYLDCIKRYDSKRTLFYLDPPYWNTEHVYGRDLFDRSEYEKMTEGLSKIKGAFILSINDVPEIRKIFGSFHIAQVDVTYGLRRDRPAKAKELMISNRPLKW